MGKKFRRGAAYIGALPRLSGREARGQRILLVLCVSALAGAFAMLHMVPSRAASGTLLLELAALALIAEFLPVQISKRCVSITFALPFIAAIAVTSGPFAAWVVDALVTLIAGGLSPKMMNRKAAPLWTGLNAASAANCCLAGTGALALWAQTGYQGDGATPLQSLIFMLGYGVMNFALVGYLEWTVGDQPVQQLRQAMRVGFYAIGPYALVALLVAELSNRGLLIALPLMLVPIWTLRCAILRQNELYDHYYETVTALMLMLQRAHPYTHGHLERAAIMSEEVARRMGMNASKARLVREAAVLHDIGKIAVSEDILDKPGKLTEDEMNHVRKHSEYGAQILEPMKQFRELTPWIRYHHERPDGTGYPERLQDFEIPLESKIIAVVDAFDAMTGGPAPGQQRTYREPMSVVDAIVELERCAGTQFDPGVVRTFRAVVEEGYRA